ncbi:MAG: DUF4345 family protein [Nevskiales bacterium]
MIGYLFVTGLIFALVGLYSLIDPNAALAPLDLHFQTVNSFSQERGTAGGVTLAVGILLIASAHYRRLVLPALWMVTMVLGGLEAGRLVSLMVDGTPGKIVWIYAAFEVFGLLQGIFWLRRELAAQP